MTQISNPLADMARIKESLMSMFLEDEDTVKLVMPVPDDPDFTREQNWYGGKMHTTVTGQPKEVTLTGHCFELPYLEGAVPDSRCALFIEPQLLKVPNRFLKEVGVAVTVFCHKYLLHLSVPEKEYFASRGIYGNRTDCLCQTIDRLIMSLTVTDSIKKNYAIGDMQLSEKEPVKLPEPGSGFYGKILSYTYHSNYQIRKKRNG